MYVACVSNVHFSQFPAESGLTANGQKQMVAHGLCWFTRLLQRNGEGAGQRC